MDEASSVGTSGPSENERPKRTIKKREIPDHLMTKSKKVKTEGTYKGDSLPMRCRDSKNALKLSLYIRFKICVNKCNVSFYPISTACRRATIYFLYAVLNVPESSTVTHILTIPCG